MLTRKDVCILNMKTKTMNGATLYEMLNYGYRNLVAHYKQINDLNVFPVPDGDTGTNMKLTYANGLKTITDDDADVGQIIDEFARGMLFGARGNSGVLTSQYFRGFADELKNERELTVNSLSRALVSAYLNAYKACVDVTEGTILTVAREGIQNTKLTGKETLEEVFAKVVDSMRISLDNTPNLLAILKENGVIDSGGKGLLTIFEGFLMFLRGEEISDVPVEESKKEVKKDEEAVDYSAFNENSVLDYGYCTEFLLQLLNSKIDIPSFDIDAFIEWMQNHGESLVCFQTGTIVKVHIHTKKPYEVIEFAQQYGEFVSFKMENMALQHNSIIKEEEKKIRERKKIAFISIAQGDGIIDLFKQLNCDIVLNGGQTMNTSVSEMIDAFKYANADEIILLPNESNMCKAAHQAANLFKESKVRVIETKTIPEGYHILTMRLGLDDDENLFYTLKEALPMVTPLIVFKSGKDANIGKEVAPKGTFVESIRHDLVGFKDNRKDAVLELLSKVEGINEKEVMFIFYGQMMSDEEANDILEAINQTYPNLEVGLVAGKQDVYDLLIGIIG